MMANYLGRALGEHLENGIENGIEKAGVEMCIYKYKVYLRIIPNRFYGFSKLKNWMCKLWGKYKTRNGTETIVRADVKYI